MSQDLIKAIENAIKETEEWPTKGWKQLFGIRKTEVNSLADAEALDRTFVYKIEAVAYWTNVKNASEEAAEWGKKALEAAKAGNLKDADDKAYYALVLEKPLRSKPVTWDKVYSMLRQNAA
ncbi:MAG: hypothetical protein OEZ34_02385 [Spirochaetia bacterium]|nr:hypothetical protein [Spirochaetia bacterium]